MEIKTRELIKFKNSFAVLRYMHDEFKLPLIALSVLAQVYENTSRAKLSFAGGIMKDEYQHIIRASLSLRQLHKNGLIDCVKQESSRQGMPTKYYQVTQKGEAVLKKVCLIFSS